LSTASHISDKQRLFELLSTEEGLAPYLSRIRLEAGFRRLGGMAKSASLNRYMVEAVQAGRLHSAGRGWYSFLPERARLSAEPGLVLRDEVRGAFPLMSFSLWSTSQLNPWLHHLVGTNLLVLSASRDSLSVLANWLEDAGRRVALNPTQPEAKQFSLREGMVLLRPLHSTAPLAPDGLAEVEGFLVELFLEVRDLGLFAMEEFQQAAYRLVSGQRVDLARLIQYSRRRKLGVRELIGNQLAALFKESSDR
jgi:hypothetical protein